MSAVDVEKERLFVTALARGLQLLRCFRRGERYLGNAELAKRSDLPKATVTRLTYTLTRLGYLDYDPSVGKYSLGAGILALGYAYLSGLSIRDQARPLMAELAEATQSSLVLGAREQTNMVCLEVCQGHPLFRLNLDVGMRVPHGITALGRAQLCSLPESERELWLERYRAESTPSEWHLTQRSIEQALLDYHEHGFCFSLGQWNTELYALGVPLAAGEGNAQMALSLSGPIAGMTRERLLGDLGPRLLALRNKLQPGLH